MPKPTIDWEAAERLAQEKPEFTPQILAAEVYDEINRMRRIIDNLDNNGSKIPNRLIGLRSDMHPETYYVRGQALLMLFDELGVLSGYFSGLERDGSRYEETPTGWRISLYRPQSLGLFQVEVVQDGQPVVDKHTAKYLATAA